MATKTRTVRSKIKVGKKESRNKSGPPAASYLSGAAPAVKHQFAETVDLPTFRAREGSLDKRDRLRLVEQAQVLLDDNYCHLPLKEAMHAVDPLQKLRLMRQRILETPEDELESELKFHAELLKIFLSVRDLHTNYLLPAPYNQMTAFVPFLVEEFFEGGERRYLVSHVFQGFNAPPFEPGVEIVRWNGIPAARAVEINGARFAGSNEDARRARGIETLTVRPLITNLPPDEERVVVDYRTEDGQVHELRVDWQVFSPDSGDVGISSQPELARLSGLDIELHVTRRAKRILFAPEVVEAEQKMTRHRAKVPSKLGLTSIMPAVLQARAVDTPSGRFGYVRIRSFSVSDADLFVDEFVRLVRQLPPRGLIIDVRGNGGGLITAGEQLLQTLTPREIRPTLFQFINTALNLRICEANPSFLDEWVPSIRRSTRSGAVYSRGFAITSTEKANALGQQYHGSVVLITDALCYSTTDIFAAGFQDHGIGTILGVDGNTGAGGANVWTHALLDHLTPNQDSPYESLPNGAGMRVSIRRTMRIGPSSGTPLEDFGVVPDERHEMTRDDLLSSNVDLINKAAAILATQTVRALGVEIVESDDDEVVARVTTEGIDRLDVYADGRPQGSIGISDGVTDMTIDVSSPRELEFRGFDEGELVARRRLRDV